MAGKSLNKVQLIGRLGKDPELRYTSNGAAVTTLSIATSESYKEGDEWKERTEWHQAVLWNRLAEIAGEYLSKGSQVYLEGRLQTRSWDDKDGNKRYTTEVVVRDMILLGGRGDASSQSHRPPHPADSYTPTGVPQADEVAEDQLPPEEPPRDDIPF